MPKAELISSSEDEDIWDYKSVPKKMRATQEVHTMSQVKTKSWIDDVLLEQKKTLQRKKRSSQVTALSKDGKDYHSQPVGRKCFTSDEIVQSYTQTIFLPSQATHSSANKLVVDGDDSSRDSTVGCNKIKSTTGKAKVKTEPACTKKMTTKKMATKKNTTRRKSKSSMKQVSTCSESTSVCNSVPEIDVLRKMEPLSVEKTPNRPASTGSDRCPVCQMPFSALSVVQSRSWHVDECLDTPYSGTKECAYGLQCDITIPSHYKKFRHQLLARSNRKSRQNSQSSEPVSSAKIRLCFGEGLVSENPIENKLPRVTTDSVIDLEAISAQSDNGNSDVGDSASAVVGNHSSTEIDNCSNGTNKENCFQYEFKGGNGSCKSSIIGTSSVERQTPHQTTGQEIGSHVSHTDILKPNLGQGTNSEVEGSDEVAVQMNMVDLVSSQTSGVLDVDKLTDNTRDVSDMLRDILGDSDDNADEERNCMNDVIHSPQKTAEVVSDNSCDSDPLIDIFKPCSYTMGIKDIDEAFSKEKSVPAKSGVATEVICNTDSLDSNRSFFRRKLEETENIGNISTTGKASNEVKNKLGKVFDKDSMEERTLRDNEYSGKEISNVSRVSGNVSVGVIGSNNSSVKQNNKAKKHASSSADSKPPKTTSRGKGKTKGSSNNQTSILSFFKGNVKREMKENLTIMTDASSDEDDSSEKSCQSYDKIISQGNETEIRIESVCSIVNGEVDILPGGFFMDDSNDDTLTKMSEMPEIKEHVSETSATLGDTDYIDDSGPVESKVAPLKRNSTDILMAASRSLSNKSVSASVSDETSLKRNNSSVTSSNGNETRNRWKRRKPDPMAKGAEDTEQNYERKCPFYKKIPGTPFTVDAFKYGVVPDCKAYILSHFHYDHYGGLTRNFRQLIYCSQITGNLVISKLRVDKQYVKTLPLDTPTEIEGVKVTFLEANHCPGAVLILFQLRSGRTHLHTGDFRASPAMEVYPALQNLRVHTLYLDTTYCDPQYVFPDQDKVISFGVHLATEARAKNPKTLIVCGSYTIGKERIFTAIAEQLDCKIAVTRDKKSVLDCLEDKSLKQRVTLNWAETGLHVVPMNKLNYKGLEEHLQRNGHRYNSVLAIEPTGWTYNNKAPQLESIKPKLRRDNITLYGIPYSEHSSFLELKRFVQFVRPEKILATVNNGNVHSRRKMEIIFEAWMQEKQKTI